MVTVDGSTGEGGGQVLRTALSLSMVTGEALLIRNIRAGRKKPGLMRQHLTAVRAAGEMCGARIDGDFAGSTELEFKPGRIRHGDHVFSIGTAGSATLVLQTVLPALLVTEGESHLALEGGTHNPLAPPFDFLDRAFLPLLRKMGAAVSARLLRHGFYPAGGGSIGVTAGGGAASALSPLSLVKRPDGTRLSSLCLYSGLPASIAERERDVLRRTLPLDEAAILRVDSPGPGNAVMVMARSGEGGAAVEEVFTAFGEKRVPAERVAKQVAAEAAEYSRSAAVLGRHCADQILLYMALAGGGEFTTVPLTMHAKTNMQVVRSFLPVDFRVTEASGICRVECVGKGKQS